MTWTLVEKAACMQGRRDRLNSGSLRIVNALGAVMVNVPLDNPSGTVDGDQLVFSGFPKSAFALLAATPDQPPAGGRLVDASGQTRKTALTVGLLGSGADIELEALTWVVGQEIEVQAAPTLTHAP